jgi:hypothetical protein
MSNLAQTYSALGRHADALAMCERVLEFLRRVLPANHPDLGEGLRGEGWVACGVVIERILFWVNLTCRHDHEQPCFNVRRPWKARGCACDV